MVWIEVHAIPNDDNLDEPRMTFLFDTTTVAAFASKPGQDHVQVFFDWEPESNKPVFQCAETLEQIEALIEIQERRGEERRADVLLRRGTRPDADLLERAARGEMT